MNIKKVLCVVFTQYMTLELVNYGYIDAWMTTEKEADRFVKAIPKEECERILKFPYEEQLKAVDEYTKKLGF